MPQDRRTRSRTAPRGSGSPSALRRANTERVLRHLRSSGASTQADLARATGLSPATVSNLVRSLVDDGRVATGTTTASGRRATQVTLVPQAGRQVALGIDVGRRHVRVVVATESGEVVGESAHELPAGHRASECLQVVADLVSEVRVAADHAGHRLVGAGLGIPGPVDVRTGLVGHGAILPEWVGLPIAETFAERLGMPVHVDNDATLGALAEARWGAYKGVQDLVYVKVASGVGSGLVLGGRVHRGHLGMTGEIGHLPVAAYGQVCRCGNRGRLETVASVPSMLAALGVSAGRLPRTSELISLVQAGDPAALRVLEDAGAALGQVCGGLCNVINPAVIAVGGPLTAVGEALLPSIRHGLSRATTPAVAEATVLTLTTLGDRTEALGAAALAHSAD